MSAKKACLGARKYDPATKKWGKYEWQTYEEVARRRDAIGSGLVKLHEDVGSPLLSVNWDFVTDSRV